MLSVLHVHIMATYKHHFLNNLVCLKVHGVVNIPVAAMAGVAIITILYMCVCVCVCVLNLASMVWDLDSL